MGVAELVPGVSGGTIAFITGIYVELVASIRRIGFDLVALVLEGRLRQAFREANLAFLLVLGAGMAASIVGLARGVSWLLENRALQLWAFFFGLIAASALVVGRFGAPWRAHRVGLGLLGVAVGGGLGFVSAAALPEHPAALFLGGAIAICAWILPGVSGSFILLLLGLYPAVIRAISELRVVTLASLAAGCTVGILLFSRLLVWLLARHRASTMAVLAGFMTGALVKIWPWRIPYASGPGGEPATTGSDRPVLPSAFMEVTGTDPAIASVLFWGLVGVLVVVALEWTARREDGAGITPGPRIQGGAAGPD